MSTVEEGLRAQVRNIEATYGRPMSAWIELIRERSMTRHAQIVAMLKSEHGLTHGSANRVALIARDALATGASTAAERAAIATGASAAAGPSTDRVDQPTDPADQLYSGKKAALRPIHERLMETISAFGTDIEVAPKKGYLSLRRKKQFAMLQPAAAHVDVGMILKGAAVTDRLESAASFNALFTHRVRVRTLPDINSELRTWLKQAYDRAGQ